MLPEDDRVIETCRSVLNVFYEEYLFQGVAAVLICFMSLLRTRHFNSRHLETLKAIACSWVLTAFPFVTALYELILIDIQLPSQVCLFVGGTICLFLGVGNAISTEVSRTECVYRIYAYGDPIPWLNDTAAYTHTSCFFKAHFKKIREEVPLIDFSVSKRKTKMAVWHNDFSEFYQGVRWTDIKVPLHVTSAVFIVQIATGNWRITTN